MQVEFRRAWLAYKPGDVTDKIGYGQAVELQRRGIVKICEPPADKAFRDEPVRSRKNKPVKVK